MASLIDRRPPAWLAGLFRAPAVLFRWHLGWLFGGRLAMLEHVGRRSGRERTSVLEVMHHESDPLTWYLAAAWGEKADWYRNLRENPRAALTVATTRHLVVATPVAPAQAADLFAGYARRHRLAARFIGRAMGVDLIHGDPAAIADRIPLMALCAQGESRASATPG